MNLYCLLFAQHCSSLHYQVPMLFTLVMVLAQFERELKIYLDYSKLVVQPANFMFEFKWL